MKPAADCQNELAVLYYDDQDRDPDVRAWLQEDFTLHHARTPVEAFALLERHAVGLGLIVADHRMVSPAGLEHLAAIGEKHPRIERIVLTDTNNVELLQRAVDAGHVCAFARKPLERQTLKQLVRMALERCVLRRELEAARLQLLQREQEEVFSFLSAGIGHEVNNPVSVLKMNFEALGESIEDLASLAGQCNGVMREDVDELMSTVKEILADSSSSVNMLENMAHDLRVLGTPPGRDSRPLPADANAAVARAMRLLARQAAYRGSVELRLEEVPLVMADERGLAQVVINLLTNAMRSVDAMGDAREPGILVETAAERDHVLVRVRDNGDGAPERGTATPGLGLSLCTRLVESWGGTFESEVLPGRRTHTARLRRADAPPEEETGGSRPFAAVGAVLVVDDDPMVLRAIERCLGKRYRVATAGSGAQAWELLETREFDAVLCDLHMPAPDGPALFQKLRVRSPAMAAHVAFMTAGSSTPQGQHFIDEAMRSGLRVLRKPLTSDQLRAAVAELISRS